MGTTKIFPDDMKFEPEKLIAAAKRSLENLDTDYVDLLLLHWPDDRVPLSETIPALCELQKQGLTRHIGVSNFNIAHIIEAKQHKKNQKPKNQKKTQNPKEKKQKKKKEQTNK